MTWLGAVLPHSPAADWWEKLVVEGGAGGFFTSLAVLPNGQPAISFREQMEDALKFAWFTGADWQIVSVDQGNGAGLYSSLLVLPTGQPAISYFADWTLRYAQLAGEDWQITTVDPGPRTGLLTSLALLPSGEPAISYTAYEGSMHLLKYAWRAAGTWHVAAVTEIGSSAGYTTLVMLPDGEAAISYQDGANHLAFTWREGGAWRTETVDPATESGRYNSMAVLPSGEPIIIYYAHTPTPRLKCAVRRTSGWELTDVFYQTTGQMSLRILPAGYPAFSFADAGGLGYVWYDGTAWQRTIADGSNGFGGYSSLTVLPSGFPAISYLGNPTGLNFAWFDGDTWRTTAVGPAGINAGDASIASLADGRPAIIYYAAGAFKYAIPGPSGWDYSVAQVVSQPSKAALAILPHDQAAIAFTARTDTGWSLFYVWQAGDEWQQSVVDDQIGRYAGAPDLAVLPGGSPVLVYAAYSDSAPGGMWVLRYAWLADEIWHKDTVDARASGGSLAILPSGEPAVAYGGAGGLRYAWRSAGVWQRVLAAPDVQAASVSLALLPSGCPAIAYVDNRWNAKGLKYTWFDGQVWHNSPVGTNDDIGSCALAILRDGTPIIGFMDFDAGQLRTARQRDDGWDIVNLDYVGYWGHADADLTALATGEPAIAVANDQHKAVKCIIRRAASGDLNCDGLIDDGDIDPFVLALTGADAYDAQYPNCNWLTGDCNGDGTVNFDDIDPFVVLLGG